MEFSEIFSFLIILKESIQILSKNGKLTAILSLVLPSILLLSFTHLSQYQLADIYTSQSILNYLPASLLLLAEIALLLVYLAISHASVVAAILVASASYNSLSSNDLFTSMKRTSWRKTFAASFHFSRTRCLSVILLPAVLIGLAYPDIFIISTVIIIATVITDFQLYSSSSVVWGLSLVVLVLEEVSCCSPGEAMERAGDLVKGGRQLLKGCMLNVFISLPCLVVYNLVWAFKFQNLTVYGMLLINTLSIMKMVLFMAYTVLYFQCKEHHGDEIC
ncbi:hypothetical protein PHJA_000573400 [Phtheirospermum japonicum]|uniref:Uncharacterized protein n=1 Tax=Phtheirospermum japonicum TaxID=374723 RepID=A0A830BB84_9LAMI|nr:hypothetical protein PHJA_000573400 [Phtheirospermum japonicum]